MSNGWHTTIVSFRDGPAKIFETYTGDYNKNYTQHIEYLNETMYDGNLNKTVKVDLVEDITVAKRVSKDSITIKGEQMSPDNPLADIREVAYNKIAKYKFAADEQAALVQQTPILIVIFHNKSMTHLHTRGFTSTYTHKLKRIEKRIQI